MVLTPLSELDAVNAMLELVQSAPVNTLPDSGVSEAYMARSLLHRTSREIQSQGWSFNTDFRYTLTPNVFGFIELPSNCLRIDASDFNNDYIPRLDSADGKMKLYDLRKQTFVFASGVELDIVWFMPWDGLPDHARNYIYVKAARAFQARFQTNPNVHELTAEDEIRARAEFLSAEYAQDDDTFLLDYTARTILRRSA